MINNNIQQSNWFCAIAALLCLTLALPANAQRGGMDNDPDRVVAGGGVFPDGWSARVDMGRGGQPQSADLVVFKTEGEGFHATMGPAATFYNTDWTKSGNYTFSVRAIQTEKPSHPISYGIFIGGTNLDTDDQSYTYFLVHADREGQGQFYIANRKGMERPTAVEQWTTHDAINDPDEAGRQQNILGVQVQGNNVIFTANGTEVARKTKNEVMTDGMIGFRVTHNTDVTFDQIKR